MSAKKKVWITGSTGFIGGALLEHWLATRQEELELALLVRSKPSNPREGVRYVVPGNAFGEFGREELRRLREEFSPDLVVHLATRFQNGYSVDDADAMIDANLRFSTRILEACRDLPHLGFLNFGSFYSHAAGDFDSPATFYAASKRAFESFLNFYCDRAGWKAVTLKIYDTYGPRDPRLKLIPKWVEILRTGEEMKLSPGGQKLSLVHVADILAATDLAANRLLTATPEHGHEIFQLPAHGDPEKLPSLREISEVFETAAGRKLPLRFGVLKYRDQEIMKPTMPYPILPGWTPKVSLLEGFREILR